jgi:hypothetical protein
MIGMLSWLFKFSDHVCSSFRLLVRGMLRPVNKFARGVFNFFKRNFMALAEVFSRPVFMKAKYKHSTSKRRGYPQVTFFGRVFKRFGYFNRVFWSKYIMLTGFPFSIFFLLGAD